MRGYKKPKEKVRLFKSMIDLGIKPCIVDSDTGWNHLHIYAFRSHPFIVEIAEILIEKGVKINLQDNLGNTPTHFLARSARSIRMVTPKEENSQFEGLKDTLKLFQKNGANFSIKNKKEKTAYDVAKASTKAEIMKYGNFSCPDFISKYFLPKQK